MCAEIVFLFVSFDGAFFLLFLSEFPLFRFVVDQIFGFDEYVGTRKMGVDLDRI